MQLAMEKASNGVAKENLGSSVSRDLALVTYSRTWPLSYTGM